MSRFWYLLSLARQSAWNRKYILVPVAVSIVLSTTLLVGLERVRTHLRASFTQTVSGTDLVVGARGNDLQLLLYAIFHIGGVANNMSWNSVERIASKPDVAWAVPISLGDSHRGFTVVATTKDFFTRYNYQRGKAPHFIQGATFDGIFDVALGAGVARKTGYALGEKLTLSHGAGQAGPDAHDEHGDKPFTVTGLLAPTGTPLDNSLYISLEGLEAVHLDWRGGAPGPGFRVEAARAAKFDLTPESVTALLVGLKSRARVFAARRDINNDTEEALTGVVPGLALDQLWAMLNTGETALLLISGLVTATGLAGLISVILAGLGERRRELAILRSAGASPRDIVALLMMEGVLLMLTGILGGLALLCVLIVSLGPRLAESFGLGLSLSPPANGELLLLGGIMAVGFLASLVPALQAYRLSLADGLSVST
jgi:putative ABC transport system permease protein